LPQYRGGVSFRWSSDGHGRHQALQSRMTFQTITGESAWLGFDRNLSLAPGFASTSISAAAEKLALLGRLFNADRAARQISKIGFRFGGTVSKGGGSTIVVSLQDVLTGTGPVGRPDEVPDESFTIANGDAGFAANSWYMAGSLSASRPVSFGEPLAVVFEFGTYGGSDVVQFASVNAALKGSCHVALKSGGAWSAVSGVVPNVLFEFTDGSFGTLKGAVPAKGWNTHTYKQDTAGADEHALEFVLPFPCKVDGAGVCMSASAGTIDFEIVLYDGTAPLANGTATIDANTVRDTSTRTYDVPFTAPVALEANRVYRLAIKPVAASGNVSVHSVDVDAGGHLQAWPMGAGWSYTSRVDLGNWAAATATRRLLAGLWVCAFEEAAQVVCKPRVIRQAGAACHGRSAAPVVISAPATTQFVPLARLRRQVLTAPYCRGRQVAAAVVALPAGVVCVPLARVRRQMAPAAPRQRVGAPAALFQNPAPTVLVSSIRKVR
jgi:hypothetical protein